MYFDQMKVLCNFSGFSFWKKDGTSIPVQPYSKSCSQEAYPRLSPLLRKILISIMFEGVVGDVRSRLQRSPSHCGLPESCTEGFWTQIPRAPISWSCWSTLNMLQDFKFRDLDQITRIARNPDTSRIWWIIVEFTPLNRCEQFQMELLFTLFRQYLPGGAPSPCRAGSSNSL